MSDYLLSPAERHGANVVLHLVDIAVDDAVLNGVTESLLIRAADLAEHVGVREKNQAVRAIAELHARSS